MPHSDPEDDRSRLFATLAARSGRISQGEMDEALRVWASDRSRFVADVMIELGTIDPEAWAAVELLMREHLSRHGDDPAQALASFRDEAEVGPSGGETPWPSTEEGSSVIPESASPSTLADADGRMLAGGTGPFLPPMPPVGPRFRVLRLHARGGLGEVFVARDEELEREVALKEIQDRFADDPGSRARFLVEAKITGNLEHPGIVPVYGLGCHADGRPYYAMRLIRGESLRHAIDRFHRGESRPKSAGDRAVRLRKLIVRFLAVCEAIEYAHSRGVIHRDLKPSNVLLGPYGETLIIDWGLAKPIGAPGPEEAASAAGDDGGHAGLDTAEMAVAQDATVAVGPAPTPLVAGGSGSTERTRPGSAVGTPQYMAPEQARGELDRLGPASDIYGLGATLYAIITGRPPLDEDKDLGVMLDRVRSGAIVPARARDRAIDPDLEAICSRAMALSPEGRYPSARALAEDLERWLADEPVSARREPVTARLGRWARRRQAWVAGASAALIVGLASLGVVAVVQVQKERAELGEQAALARILSVQQAEQAARESERLQRYFATADRLRRRTVDPQPGWTWENGEGLEQAAVLRDGADEEAEVTLRTLAAEALAAFDFRPAPDLSPGLNSSCLAFSSDGKTLALGEFKAQAFWTCSVALVDWPGGAVVRRLSFPPWMPFQLRKGAQDGARRIAFDPEGRWLAVGARSGWVHCWDLSQEDPDPASWQAHPDEVLGLAFGDGGDAPVLYSCGKDGTLRRWRPEGPGRAPDAPEATYQAGGPVWDLAFHASGGLACLAGGRLLRLDPETLAIRGEVSGVPGDRLAWAPDGRILAAGAGEAITLVSADAAGSGGRAFRRLVDPEIAAAHRSPPSGLQFDPTGTVIASSCSVDDDRRVKLWDASTGRLLGSIHDAEGAAFGILDVAFHPGGDRLVATGRDRAAVFELSPHPAFGRLALDDTPVLALDLSADGRSMARLGRSGETIRVGLWGVAEGDRIAGVDVPAGRFDPEGGHGLAVSPASDRVAFTGTDGDALLWTVGPADAPTAAGIPDAETLQLSGDGRRLWARFDDGQEIGCWDLAAGIQTAGWSDSLGQILLGLHRMRSLAVAEPWLVAGGRDGRARLLRSLGPEPELRGQWDLDDGPIPALAIRPEADLAVAGTMGGSMVLLRLPGVGPVAEVSDAHPGGVSRLAFGPDGRTIASGGFDRDVRLWRVVGDELRPIATIGHATGPILGLDFAPDGRTLAVAAEGEHAARLWRLDLLERRWEELGLQGVESPGIGGRSPGGSRPGPRPE